MKNANLAHPSESHNAPQLLSVAGICRKFATIRGVDTLDREARNALILVPRVKIESKGSEKILIRAESL